MQSYHRFKQSQDAQVKLAPHQIDDYQMPED